MRHTLYLSILVLSLVTACTKEADMNIAKESEHTVKKNLFRVTRIEGHNDHWGDYIWIINYNKEQIESAFHIDTEGDTIGNFGISNNSDINYEIEVNDWIPKIDSDSISRLDQFLKNKYGAGNYSLKDSIPLVGRVLYSQKVDLYEDGRIKRQSVVHYTPREDVGTGEDFDNSYLKTYRTILMNTMKTAISASTGFIMMFTTRKTSIRKLTNAPCINTKHCMKATESLPSFI